MRIWSDTTEEGFNCRWKYLLYFTVLKTALYVIYTLVIEPLNTCMTEFE